MKAGRYNFTYEQGTDLTFLVRYRNNQGDPIDLTGYTVEGHIRESFDATPFKELVVVIEDELTGEVRVTIPRATFEGEVFKGGTEFEVRSNRVYDIELTAPGGTVERLLNGIIAISPEVTR